MITDIYITYDDDSQIQELNNVVFKESPYFNFIKDPKESFKLKRYWGARQNPFIVCFDKDKPVKVFYSETGDNIIDSLIKFLS